MKYHYYYQTKGNESRDAWIQAKDRNAAYALLKQQGIRPYKLEGRDPIAWKRWAAIGVLLVAVCLLLSLLRRQADIRQQLEEERDQLESQGFAFSMTPRHQVYGDPAIIEEGIRTDWLKCGFSSGERILSKFALPGTPAVIDMDARSAAAAVTECINRHLEESDRELLEYRQIKRIVETMKLEAREYINGGGTAEGYLDALIDRQRREMAFFKAAEQEVSDAYDRLNESDFYEFWVKKNSDLRAIGLPTVPYPGG